MGKGGVVEELATDGCHRLRVGGSDARRTPLREGRRYSDLEYAILRELGHPPVPVATTVHSVQILDEFPRDPTDLPLTVIVTPEKSFRVPRPPKPPNDIDWNRLSEEDLEAMPVLRDLRSLTARSRKIRRARSKK